MAQLEPKKISALSDEQKSALLEALGVQTVLPVLTEYPTTDDTKAGTKFLYKGNEWHYMTQAEIDSTGWTGLVNVGFPAPVCKTKDTVSAGYNAFELNGQPATRVFTVLSIQSLGVDIKLATSLANVANISPKITRIIGGELLGNLMNTGTTPAVIFSTPFELTDTAINDFFTQLPETTKTATINVAEQPGASTCDPTIATAKGYTVITS